MKLNQPDSRLTGTGTEVEKRGQLLAVVPKFGQAKRQHRRQHCGWKAMTNNGNNTYAWKFFSMSLNVQIFKEHVVVVVVVPASHGYEKWNDLSDIKAVRQKAYISRPYLSIWVAPLNEDDVELQQQWKPRQTFQFTARLSCSNPHSSSTFRYMYMYYVLDICHELLWHDAICLILNEWSRPHSCLVPINIYIHINITVCMQFAVWHCWDCILHIWQIPKRQQWNRNGFPSPLHALCRDS